MLHLIIRKIFLIVKYFTYLSFMRIAIAGGGICALTLALAAKTAGYVPIVIESRPNVTLQSFGGGFGTK